MNVPEELQDRIRQTFFSPQHTTSLGVEKSRFGQNDSHTGTSTNGCHDSNSWTIDLTKRYSPANRSTFYDSKSFMNEFLENRLKDLGLTIADFNDIRDQRLSIELPALKYGYQETPLAWEQLRTIIIVEKEFDKLSRSSDQQRDYEVFRYWLKQKYQSVLDYILVAKFRFDKRKGDDSRWYAYPSLKETAETQTKLVPNDFPYSMEKGIVHYVLWKTKQSVLQQDIEEAKKELGKRMKVIDTLHWINPPHLQSLPEIDHVHILCLLEDDSAETTESGSCQNKKLSKN